MTEEEKAIQDCREWLTRLVDIDCRSGAYGEENILEALADTIEGELGAPHPALLSEIAEKVKPGLAAQEQAERGWQGRTVNDAIESAFATLTERGVLAVECLGVTTQEGWARAEALAVGLRGVRGCCFFHRQDLERAVDGEGLYLAFGAWDSASPAALEPAEPSGVVRLGVQRADHNAVGRGARNEATCAIGREVVAVLKHYGVGAQWDGSHHTRIVIPPFPWQKRRTTVAPPPPEPPSETEDLGALPPKPPAPPVCTDCKGRGWLPELVEGAGSDLCWCKGGKRRVPATAKKEEAPSKEPEPAPAVAAAAEPPAAAAPPAPPVSAEPATPVEEPPPPAGGVLGWIKRLFR